MKNKYLLIGLITLFALLMGTKESQAITIDFETLSDSEVVTTQFAGFGIIFENATALTAGISLNEFEFPPYSGNNVVFDDGGPITLTFGVIPMADFKAYFTYSLPLTLFFYDIYTNLVGVVTSDFTSNLALSGDLGSSPNELKSFAWASGISRVVIIGDPGGNSFTMDDLNTTQVPEPATLLLLGCGLLCMASYGLRMLRH